jgi:hypothetical protein
LTGGPSAPSRTTPELNQDSTHTSVSEPNGAAEREADRVATAVLAGRSGPAWGLSRLKIYPGAQSLGGTSDEEAPAARADSPSPIVHGGIQSPGHPLDSATRRDFERRLGHDFGRVRVHTDAEAADSARAVNARAYAAGDDLVFGAGQYAPETSAGRQLLAHELTHVAQSRSASPQATGAIQRQALAPEDARRQRLQEIDTQLQSRVITEQYRTELEAERSRLLGESGQGAGSVAAARQAAIRLNYAAAPDAYHGVQLAYVAERDIPLNGTGSPGVQHSTLYWIAPQVRQTTDQAVAYIAYNPQNHRNEWVIGPGEIGTFLAHERMYFGLAQSIYPFADRAEPPSWASESGRVAERALAGDLRGMFRAWVNSWRLAIRDPHWWVMAVTATAGAAAAAPEAEAGAAIRAGEAPAGAATKAASGPQYYIQDGVRRAVAAREAGLADVPATVYEAGQAPRVVRIPLDQLNSPKPSIPYDPRFSQGTLRPTLEGSTPPPITVEPLGRPGQLPSTPVRNVTIEY